MAVHIGIGNGKSPQPISSEPGLQLSDDAPYCFLHPLFGRLAEQTGQYVDLYGDASFAGENLVALKQMLAEARELAKSQPDSWEVHVGTQLSPVRIDLYKPLERANLLKLIETWEQIVSRAEQLGRPVVCFGD